MSSTFTKRVKALSQVRFKDIKIEVLKEHGIFRALMQKKPVAFYAGWTGHGNLGDELLFQAHQDLFSRLHFAPFRRLSPSRILGMALRRRHFVAGFLGGGTLINQSPAWLDRMLFMKTLGLPIYCFGTGVTEDSFRFDFENTSLTAWSEGLTNFAFTGIRGPRSEELLVAAGYDRAVIIGDTALALAPEKMTPENRSKVIGLNYGLVKKTQIWGESDAYTKAMAASIKELVRHGYQVRLLPVWAEDVESNNRLLRMVNMPECTMRVAFGSYDDYARELRECEYFVGQKLHATIMACMERVPCIMVEYQPKCRDFMRSVEMDEMIIKTSEYSPEQLLAKIEFLNKEYRKVRNKLNNKVLEYKHLQHELAHKIESQLLSRAR